MTAEKTRGTRTGRKSQAPSSQVQEIIESTINPPHYYNKEPSRHTAITKKLAIFIGTTNVPFSLVDSDEFCELLQENEFLKRSAKHTIIC